MLRLSLADVDRLTAGELVDALERLDRMREGI